MSESSLNLTKRTLFRVSLIASTPGEPYIASQTMSIYVYSVLSGILLSAYIYRSWDLKVIDPCVRSYAQSLESMQTSTNWPQNINQLINQRFPKADKSQLFSLVCDFWLLFSHPRGQLLLKALIRDERASFTSP